MQNEGLKNYNMNQNKIARNKYLGLCNTNHQGISMKIVDYINYGSITVEFDNGEKRSNVSMSAFKTGNVPCVSNNETIDDITFDYPDLENISDYIQKEKVKEPTKESIVFNHIKETSFMYSSWSYNEKLELSPKERKCLRIIANCLLDVLDLTSE